MRNGSNPKKGKNSKLRENEVAFEPSSGNVFEDLNFPNPELALAKAKIVQQIREIIEKRKFTQKKAAEILKIDQPKVSALIRGRVQGYSIDRLFRFLHSLGHRVEISIRPAENAKESIVVVN